MGEFIKTHSAARYNHDVERGLDLFRSGISLDDRTQTTRMWNSQRNDGKDWVVIYIRDCVTMNLLSTFQVPLNVTATQHSDYIHREMQRLRTMWPMQADRMMVCHE